MIAINFIFHAIDGCTAISQIAKGVSNKVPLAKTTNINVRCEIAAGFFLAKILYVANASAASNTHQLPLSNRKLLSKLQLPFDNSSKIPNMHTSIPVILKPVIFSFKKIRARITVKTGEEVVPIKARFSAVVYLAPTYTNVLNKLTPLTAAPMSTNMDCDTSFLSAENFLMAKGNKRTVAVSQRKNARLIGGIDPATSRATIKLPLQMNVAITASSTPNRILFFGAVKFIFKNMHIYEVIVTAANKSLIAPKKKVKVCGYFFYLLSRNLFYEPRQN